MSRTDALIAIVDDDPLVRRSLGRVLRSAGYSVTLHETAELMLESLVRTTPDVIILDLNMPRFDGFALDAELSRRGYVIPRLVVSASTEALARAQALLPAAIAFLTKPVESTTLLDAVALALHSCSR